MPNAIKTIRVALPFRLGTVNCYLVETDSGFILIDTGASKGRSDLESALIGAGCEPGDLKLIILTHGDFDHTGNAAHLRAKFGARIAMHADDSGMAERGDMFSNRGQGSAFARIMRPLLKTLSPRLFGFGRSERFTPDFYLQDGRDLSEHGFDAQVLSIPGHSRGSIGILTIGGDLFCGDLLENPDEPALGSILDDVATAKASVEKLKGFEVGTVYPGHGEPFRMELFTSGYR
jgi:hydroxyacylglutathione hydrolase